MRPWTSSLETHLLYRDQRWLCTLSGDNWRPICSTSYVLANRRNIYHRLALLWHFRDSGARYKTADLLLRTYLLTANSWINDWLIDWVRFNVPQLRGLRSLVMKSKVSCHSCSMVSHMETIEQLWDETLDFITRDLRPRKLSCGLPRQSLSETNHG